MIQTYALALPHDITLDCRAAGEPGRPLLVFLHGFPEGAFVWDALLEHFSKREHGGYRCVAPNLRGYAGSSTPDDVEAYRVKHLMQDIAALIAIEGQGRPAEALVAHDWGGAVAWSLANRESAERPTLLRRLAIFNSPHPGTFARELRHNPRQQAASAYMNFLVRPDAADLLGADDHARMWRWFADADGRPFPWMDAAARDQYRALWRGGPGLAGGCRYYAASPLRPATPEDPAAAAVNLPESMLTVAVRTLVLWGMKDEALLPELIDGLGHWVPRMTLHRLPEASHWLVHEQPQQVIGHLSAFLAGD